MVSNRLFIRQVDCCVRVQVFPRSCERTNSSVADYSYASFQDRSLSRHRLMVRKGFLFVRPHECMYVMFDSILRFLRNRSAQWSIPGWSLAFKHLIVEYSNAEAAFRFFSIMWKLPIRVNLSWSNTDEKTEKKSLGRRSPWRRNSVTSFGQ